MLSKKNNNILKTKSFLSETQIIAMGFVVIILAGAFLLILPISSRTGMWTPPIDALFTATTSTCVTGLVIADTFSHWSLFGQLVILVLIQTGGLGFMTVAALFALVLHKRIGIRQRLLMSESISLDSISGIVRMMRKIILCTLVFELFGTVLLSIRFIPEFGIVNGIYKAIFHSVTAFCNAGIDLMGEKMPLSSLTSFADDVLVNLTICFLIIVGGLGFYVWEDLWCFCKKKQRLHLHTKLVLTVSLILCVAGTVCFLVFEYSNPGTMGNMSFGEKLLASFFHSVSTRTAGYNTMDLNALTGASIIVTILLMFVGGSPGSTAGGIKTTTFALLVLTARSVVRGASCVNIWGRNISEKQILRAFAIVVIAIGLVCAGSIALCAIDNVTFKEAVFEVVSAFGTVGLTLGVTQSLSNISKLVLILLMYLGRVGILTAAFAIAKNQHNYESRIAYPKETIFF